MAVNAIQNFAEYFHQILFFTSLLFALVFQVLLQSLCKLIFNEHQYRQYTNFYYAVTMSHILYLFEWWSENSITLYVDPEVFSDQFGNEKALLVANHRYEIDFIITTVLAAKTNISYYLKSYVRTQNGIIGKGFRLGDYVQLQRSFRTDEDVIKRQLLRLCRYEQPIWTLFFPEGTRYTGERHKVSLRYSLETNKPKYGHHLLPRVKGFTTTVPAVRHHFPALYNMQIAITAPEAELLHYNNNGASDDTSMGRFRSFIDGHRQSVHIFIERHDMLDVPTHPEGAIDYLFNLFYAKDALMADFVKEQTFAASALKKNMTVVKMPRQIAPLLLFLCWVSSLNLALVWIVWSLVNGGMAWLGMLIAVTLIIGTIFLRLHLLRLIEINKDSKAK